MKAVLTIAFDGDSDAFVGDALGRLRDLVDASRATRATLDVRLPDSELEAFGAGVLTQRDERALIVLWDVDGAAALELLLPPGSRVVGAYNVDEVVQKNYEQTWPSGAQSPGFKMTALLRRRSDLTHVAFSEHWRNRHGPLAVARQPGFWRYVQNHVVQSLTDSSPAWDGIGEIHFRTVDDALNGSYDSEEGQQLIWEDVARFLDYESSPTLTTHEWVVTP